MIDRQASGAQTISVEDPTGCMHVSDGVAQPAEDSLRSEVAIIAGIAQATLERNPKLRWSDWVDDYCLVRDAIEATWPKVVQELNGRVRTPGGFQKPIAAHERVCNSDTGKANFIVPDGLVEDSDVPERSKDVLRPMKMRSYEQFNRTIYSLDDRFRGIYEHSGCS